MPELWYTDIRALPADAAKRPLSRYREDRLAGVTNTQLRAQGIAAERLLEQALRRHDARMPLPLDIRREEQGRPVLYASPWRFSLSHSGFCAACALAGHPVGLDVQELSRYQERLAVRCFTDRERQAFFPDGADDGAFTLLWALKESYLKMTGAGLRVPMNSFSVLPDGDGASARSGDAAFWYAREGELFFSLCVPGGFKPQPSVFSAVELL